MVFTNSCKSAENVVAKESANPTVLLGTQLSTPTRQPISTTATNPLDVKNQRYFQAKITEQANKFIQAGMDNFPTICENSQYELFSPDQHRLVRVCTYDYQENNQTLEIVTKSGQEWVLQSKDYFTKEFKDNSDENKPYGEIGLLPVNWSTDGKYLYFGSKISIDADGPCFFGFGDNGLYRIDVESGEVTTILYPSPSLEGYHYAFSPDGRWLAYGKGQPNILDLKTGKNYPINKDGSSYGFSWSPDSSKFAFVIDNSTLAIFSIGSKSLNTLINEEGWCLNITPTDNQLRIEMYSEKDGGTSDKKYLYDWTSGIIIQSTPIP